MSKNNNLRICVCLHLFYLEMANEIKKYLENLTSYELYITTPKENKDREGEIYSYFPNARIIYTENVGFDIYPFVCFLKNVNLDDYDLVYKIHSKKDIPITYFLNGFNLSGENWRYYLMNSILGSKEKTKYIEKCFQKNPKLGMMGAKELIIRNDDIDNDIDFDEVKKTMQELNLAVKKKEFIAGSIFVVRAEVLKALQARDYKPEDFPPYLPRTWNELPYCLERCFGLMNSAQGYRLKGIYSEKSKKDIARKIKFFLRRRFSCLYKIYKRE